MVGEAIAVAPAADSSEPAADCLARLFDTHQARLYRLARRMSGTSRVKGDQALIALLTAATRPRGTR